MLTTNVWKLSEQDFPSTAPIETQLRFLLRYAILAPSAKNTQPWNFTVEVNRVQIFAALQREQPVADPEHRELYISVGCALENLLVAAEHFGFHHEVTHFPTAGDARHVATVAFSPGGKGNPARAGITPDSILQRHNDNSVYREEPVPEEIRERLQACLIEPELRLDLTDSRLFRRWIDAFTLEADRLAFADSEFRKELGYWIGQGALGQRGLAARLGGLAVSHLDLGEPAAQQDHELVESASLLGLISATSDSHLVHVRTGQLFERLWLAATGLGISIHPMSQTMRHPDLRAGVAELIPQLGSVPQHCFRVGYSSQRVRHTPRRPLRDVLLEGN